MSYKLEFVILGALAAGLGTTLWHHGMSSTPSNGYDQRHSDSTTGLGLGLAFAGVLTLLIALE